MITPQNGIFAQGTHSHYFLELNTREGVRPERALVSLRDFARAGSLGRRSQFRHRVRSGFLARDCSGRGA